MSKGKKSTRARSTPRASRNGSGVMDAAADLERAHVRRRELKRELRATEGDIRRALSTMKRITASPRSASKPAWWTKGPSAAGAAVGGTD